MSGSTQGQVPDQTTESIQITATQVADSDYDRSAEERLKLALGYFEHVEKQVGLAATTAQIIVAASALLITAYVQVFKGYDWTTATWGPGLECVVVVGGLCLGVGIVLALIAAFPNMRPYWSRKGDLDSVFYFQTVAAFPHDHEYIAEFRRIGNKGEFEAGLLRQIWGKSVWLRRMFKRIQIAIGFLVAGTCLGIAVSVFVYLLQSFDQLRQVLLGSVRAFSSLFGY
jgi:hypothetical protein